MNDLINMGMQFADQNNPVAIFDNLVTLCNDIVTIQETEITKREEILADKAVKIEAIRSQKELLMEYLNKTFDERSENFNKFFEVIDNAIEKDNIQQLSLGLDSLNKLAAESPFKGLADLNALGTALDNKTEFDF